MNNFNKASFGRDNVNNRDYYALENLEMFAPAEKMEEATTAIPYWAKLMGKVDQTLGLLNNADPFLLNKSYINYNKSIKNLPKDLKDLVVNLLDRPNLVVPRNSFVHHQTIRDLNSRNMLNKLANDVSAFERLIYATNKTGGFKTDKK